MVPSMSSFLSWKSLALALALINLKNLPFVWHLRLLYYFIRNLRLRPYWPLFSQGVAVVDAKGRSTHPVFVPCTIRTRTPLLETDYNLHKSNSTYFSDLDVARTALVTRLYSPGMGIVSRQLDQELLDPDTNNTSNNEQVVLSSGSSKTTKESRKKKKKKKKQPIYIALGSVYCSFRREIKPFELYEIESRVIAWDEKWLYTLSFFLRPAKRRGDEKTLLASAISKYVVKKGRLTVPPERVLRLSGFLPPRPEPSSTEAAEAGLPRDSSGGASTAGTPTSVEGLTATGGVDGLLLREVLKLPEEDIPRTTELESKREMNAGSWDPATWTWEKLEEERQRGLKVVESYAVLDSRLYEEWKQ